MQFFGWVSWLSIGGIIEEGMCCFCGSNLEATDYVLLQCNAVWRVWSACLCAILFVCWQSWNFRNKKKMICEVLYFAIFWSLWTMRNECVFEGVALKWDEVIEIIKVRVAFWLGEDEGKALSRLSY